MTIWHRVSAYFRDKDNQRLLACYWALASAGEAVYLGARPDQLQP